MSEVLHGACLCGRVTFEVHEPEVLGACHCTRCQRWTGGPGLTQVVVAPQKFNVIGGLDSIQQYREQGFEDRYFCGRCGSSLYTDDGEKYYVGAGTLRDVTLEPSYHYQVAFKAPWYTIGDGAPQYLEWAPDES